MEPKELREAQARCQEINKQYKGEPVKVRGVKAADVIFECTGPTVEDCSVLVAQPSGRRKRVMTKLAEVSFPAPKKEDDDGAEG